MLMSFSWFINKPDWTKFSQGRKGKGKVGFLKKFSLHPVRLMQQQSTTWRDSDLDWKRGTEEVKWEEDTAFHCSLRPYLVEHTNIHSNIIHNSQKVERSQVDEWTTKL